MIAIGFTVTDSDGDAVTTGTLTVDIDDDSPIDISPDTAVIANVAGGLGTASEDLDFLANVGADQPGDVVFTNITDGDALMGLIDGGADVALTSGDQPILLDISADGHTVIAFVNVDGLGLSD